ncbi:MaoC family dehydratase [Collimonas humicola]|uniref:MaoC family dehydratase n=1 Tax=Collimonas humicola TaxID=2825886 RepID=UPI001B8D4604|nr:MaoC family dehydratase [Collimonas humicola]
MNQHSSSPQPALYLDDLTVGSLFVSGEHAMDEQQILAFAQQFDPQPFHLSDAAARETLFGGLAAITMRLLVTSGMPLQGGIIGSGGELSWPRPTRASDILHVESEVLEVTPSRSRPDRGMVKLRSETRNQHGEIVQLFISKLVVSRKTP